MSQRPWLVLVALVALLAAVTALWVSIDRRPPESDHANHLERALRCHLILARGGPGRWQAILDESSFYPPIVSCAAGLLYFIAPVAPLTAQSVMLAALALAIAVIFVLGRRLFGVEGGLLAAFFFATAPFAVFSLDNFQLDLPLTAMVALALYMLVRTEHFARTGATLGLGVVLGLGMLTKPTFAAYVLPPLLWPLAMSWRSADRRRRLGTLALALGIAAVIALPWYGPRLIGLPMQIVNRSFKQAAEAGQVEAFTPAGVLFYPRVFLPQFGLLAGVLCAWGLWALRRRADCRVFLWLAVLAPFAMFSLIQNKNLRYTLPILPAAALATAAGVRALSPRWRRPVVWLCAAVAALSVSMADFGIPRPPVWWPFLTPLVVSFPPSPADWQEGRVLDDLARASAGRPATVAVVPNYNFFSVSSFRYEALRRSLPLSMERGWTGPPLGIDFVILKTGSQGPSFTVAKAERLTRSFEQDRYLAAIFPVIGEYPLPDQSRGILRARRIAPVDEVAPAEIAQRLERAQAAALPDYVRDAVELHVHVSYRPEAIRQGLVDRMRVEARAATVGELKRRDRAPLRIEDVRVDVEGLLVDPRRLVETGAIEVLDATRFRIDALRITQADVDALLSGQPAGRALDVRLGEGNALVRLKRFPASARVGARAVAGDPPFALNVRDVRIAGLPAPALLVDWIARHFDPSARLKNLPVPISIAPIRIYAGRIEVGDPAGVSTETSPRSP
jgi:hypothetical protein